MILPVALSRTFLIVTTVCLAMAGASAAAQSTALTAAEITALRELARTGDSGALKKLGDAYARGNGVAQSWTQAIENYRSALAAGRKSARLSLARALAKAGQGEAALSEYRLALEGGIDKAALPMALGHASGIFGGKSDPALGFSMLQQLADAGDEKAIYGLADAYRLGRGTTVNPQKAAALFSQLAARGNGRAARRLGDFYARGIGVELNYPRAIELYRSAIETGQASAGLALARALSLSGQPEAALAVYETARDAGVTHAAVQIAIGHANAAFGSLSNPKLGVAPLEEMAFSGNARAQNALLRLIERGKGPAIADLDGLLTLAEQAAFAGEVRSVEQVLRLYRVRPRITNDTVAKRKDLLQTFGSKIRPDVAAIEQIYRLHETQLPPRYYARMLEIIAAAPRDTLARILPGLIRINRNAYIFALQRELREQGYFNRRANGWLTGATIGAVAKFCREENITDSCRLGPLKGVAAKAIAAALAARPAP